MKKSRLTDNQILAILKQSEAVNQKNRSEALAANKKNNSGGLSCCLRCLPNDRAHQAANKAMQ